MKTKTYILIARIFQLVGIVLMAVGLVGLVVVYNSVDEGVLPVVTSTAKIIPYAMAFSDDSGTEIFRADLDGNLFYRGKQVRQDEEIANAVKSHFEHERIFHR